MDNVEIVAKILEIRNTENACTRAELLHDFKPIYKKTAFYKKTKKPLMQLYYEIAIEDILTLKSAFTNLQSFLNNLDAEHFLQLMDQVNESYTKTFTEGTANLHEFDDLLHIIKSK